ncbi:RES family NAD+ phosphorylase [Methylomicrobium album]|uniref:RES domain-containing protein n=2 Tax=Methylomicrobium TaxID=39773 RepID=H8GLL1_METAL|nr:RES family NAD+ phosphorylase [Methylomicrobium album]EIC29376.1 RES domain-containing protein [Methylomicrobium album BG8]
MMNHMPTPPINRVVWRPCWRLVPSRFPPSGLFDRVAEPEDLDIVFAIEALTNDRLLDESGDIMRVPFEDRISGPGTTPIMAAFTHLTPEGSRFTDGTYGVYYAGSDMDTAIAETRFHKARFLAATNEPPIEIDMRSYASDLDSELHDIRKMQSRMPAIYTDDPESYSHPQALAKALHGTGSNGIVYDSVRYAGGECIAVFKPRVLSPVRQGPHFCYVWNGEAITEIYQKNRYQPGQSF